MKEYCLPEKYIRKVHNAYLALNLFILLSGIVMLLLEFSYSAIIMIVVGILLLCTTNTNTDNITYKILLTEEDIEFIAKKSSRKIFLNDIVRISYKRKLFKNKTILGIYIYDKSYFGYIDFRISNSIELIETILSRCKNLGTKELLKALNLYKANKSNNGS